LYSDTDGCTEKEYEKIFELLFEIEDEFFKQYQLSNVDQNLTFEEERDKKTEDMKQFAFHSKLSIFCNLILDKKSRNLNKIV
jgi:hypothetical protein